MSKIDQLIRAIRRELSPTIVADLEHIFAEYGDKPAKRIPAKRKEPRVRKTVVRLGRIGMDQLRRAVYERDGGCCQWEGCAKHLPLEGHEMYRAHLAHIVSRGRGGSDTAENTRIMCHEHHIATEHAYGPSGIKPCPKP